MLNTLLAGALAPVFAYAANVADFHNQDFTGVQMVYLAGVRAPDGNGAGLFVPVAGQARDDGGVIVQDVQRHTFERLAAMHADIRWSWYGLHPGDDQATACGDVSCGERAIAASLAYGDGTSVMDVTGLLSSQNVTGGNYNGWTLDCPAPNLGQQGRSDFRALPGAINFAHGAGYVISGNQITIQCGYVTDGRGGMAVSLFPRSRREAFDNDAAARANGDIAFQCQGLHGGEAVKFQDVWAVGSATGIFTELCSHFYASYKIDAANCYVEGQMRSAAVLGRADCSPLLANNVPDNNHIYQNVSVVAAPSGSCRIVWNAEDTSQLRSYDDINLLVPNGPLSCNGVWHDFTIVDSQTVDIPGSVYSPDVWLTTRAVWEPNSSIIHIPLPATQDGQGVFKGETVTGDRTGAVVEVNYHVSDARNGGSGYMDVELDTVSTAGGSGQLSFHNAGAYQAGRSPCNETACVYHYATAKYRAGLNSLPGLITGGVASCGHSGGPGDTSTGGFISTEFNSCFEHRIGWNMAGSGPGQCESCSFNGHPELHDKQRLLLIYGSGVPPLDLHGSLSGAALSLSFNPVETGWRPGDFVVGPGVTSDDGNSCNGSAIAALQPSGVTLKTAGATMTGTYRDVGRDPAHCDTSFASFSANGDFHIVASAAGQIVYDTGKGGISNVRAAAGRDPQDDGLPALTIQRGHANVTALHSANGDVLVDDTAGWLAAGTMDAAVSWDNNQTIATHVNP